MNISPQRSDFDWDDRRREAFRTWLQDARFTHFVTLSCNYNLVSRDGMRDLLKGWDARVNRVLVGPKWHRRPDERINWIAFPEKMTVNPHWHLLLQVLDEQLEAFDDPLSGVNLVSAWTSLMPSGTVDVQRIDPSCDGQEHVRRYVTKSVGHSTNFEDVITYRDFFEL